MNVQHQVVWWVGSHREDVGCTCIVGVVDVYAAITNKVGKHEFI